MDAGVGLTAATTWPDSPAAVNATTAVPAERAWIVAGPSAPTMVVSDMDPSATDPVTGDPSESTGVPGITAVSPMAVRRIVSVGTTNRTGRWATLIPTKAEYALACITNHVLPFPRARIVPSAPTVATAVSLTR